MKKLLLPLALLAVLFPVSAFAWGHCPLGGPMDCGPMMMPPPSGVSKIAPLLIAMAAGYGVLSLAVRQTRKLSLLGFILGWFIIAVSVAGIACIAGKALCMRCHKAEACAPAAGCPFMKSGPCMAPAGDQPSDDRKSDAAKPAAPAKADRKK